MTILQCNAHNTADEVHGLVGLSPETELWDAVRASAASAGMQVLAGWQECGGGATWPKLPLPRRDSI